MAKQIRRHGRYSKKIVEDICKLIREDSYTIAEICEMVGIAKSTYYEWLKSKVDFSDAIKKAEDDFNQMVLVEAKKSLVKLIKGYSVQEKKTVTADTGKKDEQGKPIVRVKEHSVVEKHFQPSLGAIIHFQTNRDPDNWKNRQDTSVKADVAIKSHLENLSDDELQKIIDGEEVEP